MSPLMVEYEPVMVPSQAPPAFSSRPVPHCTWVPCAHPSYSHVYVTGPLTRGSLDVSVQDRTASRYSYVSPTSVVVPCLSKVHDSVPLTTVAGP